MPSEALSGPWLWQGETLAGDDAWVERLTPAEIEELGAAAQAGRERAGRLEALRREDVPLPGLQPRLERWLSELDEGRGFLLVRGLPVQRWGDEGTAWAYTILGLHLGTPVSQNAAGDRLGHVRDTGEDPEDPAVRRYKTRRALEFHTDGADVIGLLCLRPGRAGGASRLVSSAAVYAEVARRRPDLVPRLFEPWHFDRNEEQREGEAPTFQIPICHWDGKRLRTFYIGWYIRDAQRHASVPSLEPDERELLDLVDAVAGEPGRYLEMQFQAGDLQLVKNSAVLHARTAYEDAPDPAQRRHLLRLWLSAHRGFEDGDARLRGGIPEKQGVASDSAALEG